MNPGKQGSIFHTDQGKWDRRDYENSEFDDLVNDNEERVLWEGYSAADYDEGLAKNFHEDHFNDSGHIHTDSEIESVIKEIFSKTKLDKQDIKLSVKDSNVTIEGNVSTQHEKEMAEKMAKLAHGVGAIKNNLNIN